MMVNLVATYESKMPKESLLSSICRDCTVPSVPSAKLRLAAGEAKAKGEEAITKNPTSGIPV